MPKTPVTRIASNAAGFGSYLLGLNKRTYELAGGAETKGNTPGSYKEPAIGWITAFLFVSTFVGLAILIPLRKVSRLSPLTPPLFQYFYVKKFLINRAWLSFL